MKPVVSKPIEIVPAHRKDEERDLVSDVELQEITLDRLTGRAAHRNAFYEDLQSCERVILHFWNGAIEYLIYVFMASYPIVVGLWNSDGQSLYHPIFYSHAWDRVIYTDLVFDTDFFTTIDTYLYQFYSTPNGCLRTWMHPYYAMTYNFIFAAQLYAVRTIDQIYEMDKELFVYNLKGSNLHERGFASRSESEWPGLVNVNTSYIGNLGVFVPTDYTVNAVLTQLVRAVFVNKKLHSTELDSFVVLDKATLGSLEGIAAEPFIDILKNVPFAGGIIGMFEDDGSM